MFQYRREQHELLLEKRYSRDEQTGEVELGRYSTSPKQVPVLVELPQQFVRSELRQFYDLHLQCDNIV